MKRTSLIASENQDVVELKISDAFKFVSLFRQIEIYYNLFPKDDADTLSIGVEVGTSIHLPASLLSFPNYSLIHHLMILAFLHRWCTVAWYCMDGGQKRAS